MWDEPQFLKENGMDGSEVEERLIRFKEQLLRQRRKITRGKNGMKQTNYCVFLWVILKINVMELLSTLMIPYKR